MSYRITDKTPFVEGSINQRGSIFLRLIAETVVAVSQRQTPKKTGRLRMDVIKQISGLSGKIVWGKNYAVYQEEKQFKNYTTPGTGPHYARNAITEVVKNTGVVARQAGLI